MSHNRPPFVSEPALKPVFRVPRTILAPYIINEEQATTECNCSIRFWLLNGRIWVCKACGRASYPPIRWEDVPLILAVLEALDET